MTARQANLPVLLSPPRKPVECVSLAAGGGALGKRPLARYAGDMAAR
jgi:hypothetical protein